MTAPDSPQALRRWQFKALQKWQEVGKRGIAEVATGGGKTRFAIACFDAVLSEQSEAICHIVVPTTALADQWYVSLREDAHAHDDQISRVKSRASATDLRRYNISVINSARDVDPSIWTGTRRMLVVDECHRAGSPQNARALRGESEQSLGLSATPERQYDDALAEVIAPALGAVFFRYTLADAYADRVLNDFALTNLQVQLSVTESDQYARITQRLGREASDSDPSERALALMRARSAIANNAAVRIPAAVWLVERHRGARALVFHESIDSAEEIFQLLRARNHSATIYHSRLGEAMRRENLRLFRRGVYDVLVTCRALDEGVNVPEVEVAVIAAATASQRQRIQRLGRVLRPSPGKGMAQVYTIYATDNEAKRLATEAETLSGVAEVAWLSAEVG